MGMWKSSLAGIFIAMLWMSWSTPVGAITLTLVWDPPDNAEGLEYLVYTSTDGISFEQLARIADTSLCVTGLEERRWYYFAVTSINQSGQESEPTEPLAYRTGLTGDLNNSQRFEVVDLLLACLTLEAGEPPANYPSRLYLGRGDLDADGDFDAADLALMQDALSQF